MEEINHASKIRPGKKKIAVLGMGHVGLPTALGLAELGWSVTGADNDPTKIALLKDEQLPFYEPGLPELLSMHLKSGKFTITEDVETAIRSAQILFLCVGTPQSENGEADMSQIETVARTIARNLNGYKLIVEKSTVPAITAQWIKKTVRRYASVGVAVAVGAETASYPSDTSVGEYETTADNFDVASNPEFLQEGTALQNFFQPDRVVCGVESARARELLCEIYRPLKRPILTTDLSTAELIKHAANAFLTTKISFINMVADLCEAVGADVTKVAEGIGMDRRIGPEFLRAGIGFGDNQGEHLFDGLGQLGFSQHDPRKELLIELQDLRPKTHEFHYIGDKAQLLLRAIINRFNRSGCVGFFNHPNSRHG